MQNTLNIVKATKNDSYVDKNNPDFFALTHSAKRIWFKETLNLNSDINTIYNLTLNDNISYEGYILETGTDNNGNYIVFQTCDAFCTIDVPTEFSTLRIPKSKVTLTKVFSPYDMLGADDILEYLDGKWPEVWNCNMNITKNKSLLTVELSKFQYSFDLGIELKLHNVHDIQFSGDCKNYKFFNQHICSDFIIRLDNDGTFKVTITNTNNPSVTSSMTLLCDDIEAAPFNAFFRILDSKNVKYTHLDNSSNPTLLNADKETMRLKLQWASKFASKVRHGLHEIHFDKFIWHIFSYNKLPYREKDEANQTFNAVKKENLFLFFNNSDISYKFENASKVTFDDFMFFTDVYICDTDFTWTYAITHDSKCGPYFHYKLNDAEVYTD